jgi:hypothetical protein
MVGASGIVDSDCEIDKNRQILLLLKTFEPNFLNGYDGSQMTKMQWVLQVSLASNEIKPSLKKKLGHSCWLLFIY